MSTTDHRKVHDPEGLNTGVWPVGADQFFTPTGSFFTRTHANVPDVELAYWRLDIDGLVDRPASFSLGDLERDFNERELAATLVCAGLRREELLSLDPLPGELPWGPEPASTGRWTGVALRDVLEAIGVSAEARYVEFTGLDQVEREGERFGFGGSISLEKALSDEVLLASGLNGAPLSPSHGFPLRAVVPGWIGARSVKWLGRITLLRDPSANYFQRKAYRVQREINPRDPRDVSSGVALSEVPLNAVIADPAPGQEVPAGHVHLRGWAIGSAGRPLAQIDVSPNGGQDWVPARIAIHGMPWTWTFWEADLALTPGDHILVVRAADSAGTTQPDDVRATWNVKGYGNNAWHRVPIVVA